MFADEVSMSKLFVTNALIGAWINEGQKNYRLSE